MGLEGGGSSSCPAAAGCSAPTPLPQHCVRRTLAFSLACENACDFFFLEEEEGKRERIGEDAGICVGRLVGCAVLLIDHAASSLHQRSLKTRANTKHSANACLLRC